MFKGSIAQAGQPVEPVLLLKAPASVEKRRLEKHITDLVRQVGRATWSAGPHTLGIGPFYINNYRACWRIIVRKGWVEVHTNTITRYAVNMKFDTVVKMHRAAWAKVQAQEAKRFWRDLRREVAQMEGASLTHQRDSATIWAGGHGRMVIAPSGEQVVLGEWRGPFDVSGRGWAKRYRFGIQIEDLRRQMAEVI